MSTTKKAAHAAGGRARAIRMPFERPETVIKGADGQTFTLPRRTPTDVVPAFQKYNPRKVDPKAGGRLGPTGKPLGPVTQGAPAQRRRRSSTVPFGRLLFGAIVAHKVFVIVRDRFFPRKPEPADSEDDVEGGFNAQTISTPSVNPVRLVPAMLRAAIPQPRRKNLAARRAQAHHSRPQRSPQQPTAWQRLHPSNTPKARAPGTLEKWETAMRKAVGGTAGPVGGTNGRAPLQLLPAAAVAAIEAAPYSSAQQADRTGGTSAPLAGGQLSSAQQQRQQQQAVSSSAAGSNGSSRVHYVRSSAVPPAPRR